MKLIRSSRGLTNLCLSYIESLGFDIDKKQEEYYTEYAMTVFKIKGIKNWAFGLDVYMPKSGFNLEDEVVIGKIYAQHIQDVDKFRWSRSEYRGKILYKNWDRKKSKLPIESLECVYDEDFIEEMIKFIKKYPIKARAYSWSGSPYQVRPIWKVIRPIFGNWWYRFKERIIQEWYFYEALVNLYIDYWLGNIDAFSIALEESCYPAVDVCYIGRGTNIDLVFNFMYHSFYDYINYNNDLNKKAKINKFNQRLKQVKSYINTDKENILYSGYGEFLVYKIRGEKDEKGNKKDSK